MRVNLESYDSDFQPTRWDPTKCYTCDTWHVALACVGCGAAMAHAEHEAMGGRCEPCWEGFRAESKRRLARDIARADAVLRARRVAYQAKRRNWLEK